MSAPRCAAGIAAGAVMLGALNACGGAGGTSTPVFHPPAGTNVAPVLVDAGSAARSLNLPSVSVTICAPGTNNCQTIDHILVDTASSGLRIIASVLSPSLTLPAVPTAAGDPMYECTIFADGYSWGSVRQADVQLADGKASKLALQLIGDPAIPVAPADCSGAGGVSENTVASFGENGVLGVSVFQQDCGSACVTIANPGNLGFYYGCPAAGCVGTTVNLSAQVQNPVAQFAGTNNNGVVVVLPTINKAGQLSASGALALGIDTQSNNQLGSAVVLAVDPLSGRFTTTLNSQSLGLSVIDSGSNGYFFADSALPPCSGNTGFYCPSAIQGFSATNQGFNSGASSVVQFNVTNADALLNAHPTFAAFINIAGPNPLAGSFDWGLPFFYGRHVFIAFEGHTTSAGSGPFVAY